MEWSIASAKSLRMRGFHDYTVGSVHRSLWKPQNGIDGLIKLPELTDKPKRYKVCSK